MEPPRARGHGLILGGMWVPFGGSHIPQPFCLDATLMDGSVAPSTCKEGLGDGTVPAGEEVWAFLSRSPAVAAADP